MSWLWLSILSALFLGVYDLCKKLSVKDNAVPPVLLLSCSVGAVCWLPFVILSRCVPSFSTNAWLFVDPISWQSHGFLFAKSALVGASWTCAFFALKHLPITIATPIRATSPLWTILMACFWMQERPTSLQWVGIVVILSSFFAFTLVGRLDGIRFYRDRWIGLMVCATLLAACSALYDKYLLQNLGLPTPTVQAWFSIYLVPVMLPLAVYWYIGQRDTTPFHGRATIPCIAICLLIADYIYFSAVSVDGAMISLISPVRRTSVVVSFLGGYFLLGEQNLRQKSLCTALLLVGVVLLSLG